MLSETLITMIEAARRLPGRVNVSTLWRWRCRGVRGIRLETTVVGGRRYTSVEALERFVAGTTAAASGTPAPAPVLSRRRKREIAAAQRECEKAGI